MSSHAPNLMLLLSSSKKSLIDKFSVCATLTDDLYNVQYTVKRRKSGELETKRKRKNEEEAVQLSDTHIPSSSSKRSALTLKELEKESDIDDADALRGFIDEKSGEHVYLIEKVIKYEPKYGYFVHWQGYSKSERSWQLPDDMPAAFAKEMSKARKKYKESRRSGLLPPDDI